MASAAAAKNLLDFQGKHFKKGQHNLFPHLSAYGTCEQKSEDLSSCFGGVFISSFIPFKTLNGIKEIAEYFLNRESLSRIKRK